MKFFKFDIVTQREIIRLIWNLFWVLLNIFALQWRRIFLIGWKLTISYWKNDHFIGKKTDFFSYLRHFIRFWYFSRVLHHFTGNTFQFNDIFSFFGFSYSIGRNHVSSGGTFFWRLRRQCLSRLDLNTFL